ncbi:hypothetical protein M404DRAFT_1008618 [Pisolithus tinctorius Marx 270]|uniref:Uncharacterized protein n=1 Tax=Pisolithus tinctorius Marx 270 TaxID=870435 RepID=A0A0C3MYN0_PISTI|nr:hypothetical protein M404DRAFT_1008618 [Pisolithus tinctorius Marx 270]
MLNDYVGTKIFHRIRAHSSQASLSQRGGLSLRTCGFHLEDQYAPMWLGSIKCSTWKRRFLELSGEQ